MNAESASLNAPDAVGPQNLVDPKYVLITPAHNEQEFIEKTIQSLVAQTHLPLRWIIVNDGSTDGTRELIERFIPRFKFMKLVNLERLGGRDFGKKILAFNRGIKELGDANYEFIGNLDADITFEPDYFRRILREFVADRKLGLAGGIVYTKVGERFVTHDKTLDSIGGAVQLFRRQCFLEVGGYPLFEQGGEDAAVEITARMKGWKVRKFPENRAYEQRRTGTASTGILRSKVQEGQRFYSLGYGFLFYGLRCIYRLGEPPLLLGSGATFLGYLESLVRRRPIALSLEVVRFLRAEQRNKLKEAARALLPIALWKPAEAPSKPNPTL